MTKKPTPSPKPQIVKINDAAHGASKLKPAPPKAPATPPPKK